MKTIVDTSLRSSEAVASRMAELGHTGIVWDNAGSFQNHPRATCEHGCTTLMVGTHSYGSGLEPCKHQDTGSQLNPFLAGIDIELEPQQKKLVNEMLDSHDKAEPPGPGSAWIG